MTNGICGTDISYACAAFSCMPIIGSLVAIYNLAETIDSIQNLSEPAWTQSIEETFISLFEHSSQGKTRDQVKCRISEQAEKIETYTALFQKRDIYSKFGIASDFLTLVGVISLISFGIFTGPLAWIVTGGLAAYTIRNAFNFYCFRIDLRGISYILNQIKDHPSLNSSSDPVSESPDLNLYYLLASSRRSSSMHELKTVFGGK